MHTAQSAKLYAMLVFSIPPQPPQTNLVGKRVVLSRCHKGEFFKVCQAGNTWSVIGHSPQSMRF